MALIRNYSAAVVSWELGTRGASDPWRHTEAKMREVAAELATTAPETEVLLYMQGQLAMDWYESTRALLPPPCGTDSAGAFADFWLLDNATHSPAAWPSPHGSICRSLNGSDLQYDFGQAKVRDYFVRNIVLPFADAPNVRGVFLDDADSLPCASDLCSSFNGVHFWPCGAAPRERLFNGIVAWTKDVTARLNARGQIPIFNSNNDWNASSSPPGQKPRYGESSCPRSEAAVHAEFGPGLVYGRFQEAWNARCPDIWNAREEADAGIPLFIHGGAKGIDAYTVAAFLMAAGNQSFMANSHGWTDGGTSWHPEFYEQPLGQPLGRSVQSGYRWRRDFEHVSVSLDCWTRQANFTGWRLPVPHGLRRAAIGLGDFTFVMLPGQAFTAIPCHGCPPDSADTFYVGEWGASNATKRCVVKTEKNANSGMPFAFLTMAGGAPCPVGAVFDITQATPDKQRPWQPYPTASASPRTVVFRSAAGTAALPDCENNTLAIANRNAMNAQLAALRPGDVFVVPAGVHCLAAGVHGSRLSHVTLDINGDLFFNQDVAHWSNSSADSGLAHGILLEGITNVTITSSNRTGRVRSNGCAKWYFQRTFEGAPGPPPLIEVRSDSELTFASSHILWEHMAVQDGPNWQTYWNKVTDLVIRHVKVDITCIPPDNTIENMLGALALNTDGIDIWGSNVHVHDVEVTNADDCICVKGDNDGSRIWSENWVVENSKARGEGLSVGTVWSGHFITRNVTFRNIDMLHTRKAVYVKIDSSMNYADVLYKNITVHGPTLQFPVMIGPIHQFTHTNCDWYWPYAHAGTCAVTNEAHVNITIDGMKITRPNGFPGYRTADFLIMGNNRTNTTVTLKNIDVGGGKVQACEDPPCTVTDIGGACNNACFAADVVTDGSYHVSCTPWDAPKVESGKCAPLMGSVRQRCEHGNSTKASIFDRCYSGLKCG